jgi:YVTN family beta-propeller protein
MLKKTLCVLMLLIPSSSLWAGFSVKKIDFLQVYDLGINAAGPLLVKTDSLRNRVILANTYTPAVSIISGKDNAVLNIPIATRVPQYLKADAMTINKRTGDIYLIGQNSFHIISPEKTSATTIATVKQFEMIAVDENSGNVFIVGRENRQIGFYKAKSQKLVYRDWLGQEEKLVNLNQTPPPAIRKVVVDNSLKMAIAVDGYTSRLFLFNSGNGKLISQRTLPLTGGGRWHFAGYNEASHHLYLVVETQERKVIQAAKISIAGEIDLVVPLPEFTEGVGITYNPKTDEVYIPYDNHASVHVVDFKENGALSEIKVPTFGNDATAIDTRNDLLYVASWAQGEIDVIDLNRRELCKRIVNLGILPHMFTIAYNPNNNLLYIPKGATAVNGSFGSAVTILDPLSEKTVKIHTGWAPIDLIELPGQESFLVFNSEDQFAKVASDGTYDLHSLPDDYPLQCIYSPSGDVYLSYGAHQTYWPVVYIWGAKNGILKINAWDLNLYDRRIVRQAQRIVLDKNGSLYMLQNNWGREQQFLGRMEDEVRLFDPGTRIDLGDEVERETTQRLLQYDADLNRLYVVRIGEKEEDPGVLQVIDPESKKVIRRELLGLTPADLAFDRKNLYVANFSSNTITVLDKDSFTRRDIAVGEQPFRICLLGNDLFVLNHKGNTLQQVGDNVRTFPLPVAALPDNLFTWKDKLVITAHNGGSLFVISFDPATKTFQTLHQENYPYGDTSFDTGNSSFYAKGQFGDALFTITQGKTDRHGCLWLTDFLSGKLFIIEEK